MNVLSYIYYLNIIKCNCVLIIIFIKITINYYKINQISNGYNKFIRYDMIKLITYDTANMVSK